MMVQLNRREMLAAGVAATGLLLAPSTVVGDATSVRPRLVLMIARGGMDGLSFAPPLNDPHYPALRGGVSIPKDLVHPLDGDFGLHPKLVTLAELAREEQVRIAPAAALWTPDRSHFRAQDLLETGASKSVGDTGWLGRAGELISGGRVRAVSIGPMPARVLAGRSAIENWSADQPDTSVFVLDSLNALYRGDPLLQAAATSLYRFEALKDAGSKGGSPESDPAVRAAETAARALAIEGGPSIAVLSFYGFDSHASQGGANGALADSFGALDRALAKLRDGLGLAWSTTAVLIVTEFGRTAAVNGRGGTDHGTASTAVLTGGAVKAGGVLGDWPGLAPNALFEARDLRPALDLRAMFKGVLFEQFGLDRSDLARRVFPDTAHVAPLTGLMAA
jgi:uncharacterized protein (DUF1501 family)